MRAGSVAGIKAGCMVGIWADYVADIKAACITDIWRLAAWLSY